MKFSIYKFFVKFFYKTFGMLGLLKMALILLIIYILIPITLLFIFSAFLETNFLNVAIGIFTISLLMVFLHILRLR